MPVPSDLGCGARSPRSTRLRHTLSWVARYLIPQKIRNTFRQLRAVEAFVIRERDSFLEEDVWAGPRLTEISGTAPVNYLRYHSMLVPVLPD